MIGGDRRKVKNGAGGALGTSGATPFFRLSATMVELSLRHKQPDSCTDVRPEFPIKVDCYSAEARGQLISGSTVGIDEQEGSKPVQLHPSELAHARQELLRRFISRISDERVKTFAWLRARTRIVALALLAFPVVFAFHYLPDSVKSQSQIPAMPQQSERPLVPRSVSQNTHMHARTAAPKKAKSRRHQSDYIAKDTYIYYGNDGKPRH